MKAGQPDDISEFQCCVFLKRHPTPNRQRKPQRYSDALDFSLVAGERFVVPRLYAASQSLSRIKNTETNLRDGNMLMLLMTGVLDSFARQLDEENAESGIGRQSQLLGRHKNLQPVFRGCRRHGNMVAEKARSDRLFGARQRLEGHKTLWAQQICLRTSAIVFHSPRSSQVATMAMRSPRLDSTPGTAELAILQVCKYARDPLIVWLSDTRKPVTKTEARIGDLQTTFHSARGRNRGQRVMGSPFCARSSSPRLLSTICNSRSHYVGSFLPSCRLARPK
ncbi:unnamed protein product [Protopolystoma xenopodis]|uniref:Uncharacterized protein n=1 Tax=Protopolystoma xenopodis TaxID=117903 RepID=A0A448WXY5_9PLAT|nr:unnamed protein product [Protopolystoma xenopodis]